MKEGRHVWDKGKREKKVEKRKTRKLGNEVKKVIEDSNK